MKNNYFRWIKKSVKIANKYVIRVLEQGNFDYKT